MIGVPFARAINPISKTNRVNPDALATAQKLISK